MVPNKVTAVLLLYSQYLYAEDIVFTASCYHMKYFGFKIYEILYYNCVVPILEYGSCTWGFKTDECLGSIHKRSTRYYLGVHRFASVTTFNGNTGCLPCVYRQWIYMICFMFCRTMLLMELSPVSSYIDKRAMIAPDRSPE